MTLPTIEELLHADPRALALARFRATLPCPTEAKARAAERKMRRLMLGSCECGEAVGEAICPWCDDDALPVHLRVAGAAVRREARVRTAEQEVRDALAKIAEQRPKIELRAPRKPNRFERRRARSRRWRG